LSALPFLRQLRFDQARIWEVANCRNMRRFLKQTVQCCALRFTVGQRSGIWAKNTVQSASDLCKRQNTGTFRFQAAPEPFRPFGASHFQLVGLTLFPQLATGGISAGVEPFR